MDHLKENLKLLIEKAATNPTQLSKATGVPQPTIKRILDGTSAEARNSTIAPIAEYFNVTVEDIRAKNLRLDAYKQSILEKVSKEGASQNQPEKTQHRFPIQKGVVERIELGEKFKEALRDKYRKNCEVSIKINGITTYVDYCSDKLAVEIKSFSSQRYAPGVGGFRNRSPLRLREALWQLSTLKLLTAGSHPDRQYFLFLTIIDEEDSPMLLSALSRLIAEASLHGITLSLADAENAGRWVSDYEEGRTFPSEEEGHMGLHDDT